ncbi:peptidylprolyl isomerase [Cerasicoccus frondis]|uniref:peptidylprolyl isomerase n=1 Tax=Cerasicoccus frondis TaxID=490090 RepID=UPI002852A1E9|nr:peptidylprolyl isomerase [Cerasicoccus frondis]
MITLTLLLGRAHAFTPSEDGLYAVFDTSMGEFTTKLFFEETTQTVANFVSLAEGTRDWVRMSDGVLQSGAPYYDGLSFHRVIAGFMIQAGARTTGVGDRPGYSIYDEMIPGNSTFTMDRAGVLAMANTGERDSGGSQFFITVAAANHLNQKHTVFGEIVEGQSVVDAINAVDVVDPENENYVPVEDVLINSVTILREGAAAQAFDPQAYTFPTFEAAELTVLNRDADYALGVELGPLDRYLIYASADLASWANIGYVNRIFLDPGYEELSLGDTLPGGDRGFWRSIKSVYAPAPDMHGHSLEIRFEGSTADPLVFSFNSDYTGQFINSSSGSYDMYYYTWHEYGDGYVNFTAYVTDWPAIQVTLAPGESGDAQLYVNNNSVYENLNFTLIDPVVP